MQVGRVVGCEGENPGPNKSKSRRGVEKKIYSFIIVCIFNLIYENDSLLKKLLKLFKFFSLCLCSGSEISTRASRSPRRVSCRMKWNLIKTQIEFLRARRPPFLSDGRVWVRDCCCRTPLSQHLKEMSKIEKSFHFYFPRFRRLLKKNARFWCEATEPVSSAENPTSFKRGVCSLLLWRSTRKVQMGQERPRVGFTKVLIFFLLRAVEEMRWGSDGDQKKYKWMKSETTTTTKKKASSDVKSQWLGYRFSFVFYGVLRVLRYARFWHGLKQHRHRVSRDIKLRFHLLARYKSWQIRKLHRICPHHRADIYIYLITSDSISKNEFFITEIKSRFVHFFLARSEFSLVIEIQGTTVWRWKIGEKLLEYTKSRAIFIAWNVNVRDYH